MKKTLTNSFFRRTVFAALLSLLALSFCPLNAETKTPQITVLVESPKVFCERASRIMKTIRPDPSFEMKTAMMLAPFGYPFFEGVSGKTGVAVCAFFDSGNEPYIALACKASKNAAVVKNSENLKFKTSKIGEFFLIELSNPGGGNLDDYADSLMSALDSPVSRPIEIKIDPEFAKRFVESFMVSNPNHFAGKDVKRAGEILSKVDKILIRIDENGEAILADFKVSSKSLFKTERAPMEGIKFMPSDPDILFARNKQMGNFLAHFPGDGAIAAVFAGSKLRKFEAFHFEGSPEELFDMAVEKFTSEASVSAEFSIKKLSDFSECSEFVRKNPEFAGLKVIEAKCDGRFEYSAKAGNFALVADSAESIASMLDNAKAPRPKVPFELLLKVNSRIFGGASEAVLTAKTKKGNLFVEAEIPFDFASKTALLMGNFEKILKGAGK